MTSTLHLTPAAAGRLYQRPRYRRSLGTKRTPQDNLRIIGEQIQNMKASSLPGLRYIGCILEAIQRIPIPAKP